MVPRDDQQRTGRTCKKSVGRRTFVKEQGKHQGELGSSTAEVAVLLPSIALLLSVLLWVGMIGSTQIAVQQAAREVAREIARGQEHETALDTAQRIAGDGATVQTSDTGQLTEVQVRRKVSMGGIEWLTIDVSAGASVLREQP